MNYCLKTIEEMDACVFSSDMLYNDQERKHFKAMVARWARALNETENVAQPQREWQGLTDDDFSGVTTQQIFAMKFAEAKLREKNT